MTFGETVHQAVTQLDAIGFNAGDYRISLYSGLRTLIVVIAVIVLARLVSSLVKRTFMRVTALDPAQRLLGEKLVSIAVWVLAAMFAIDVLGVDLTALTVFSGAFGLAIGFGLQKTLGNLIAGIILLMDRSIKPGDVIAIDAGGPERAVGQVKKIGIRAVSVTTRDKKEYLIPNELLMTQQVENWSYSSRNVRIKVPIGVAYGTDIALAERLMLQAAASVDRVLDTPATTVWLHAFGDNAIEFEIQMWICDPEEGLGNVRSDVLKQLWLLLRDNGIEIPFPQRVVTILQTGGQTPKVGGESSA